MALTIFQKILNECPSAGETFKGLFLIITVCCIFNIKSINLKQFKSRAFFKKL